MCVMCLSVLAALDRCVQRHCVCKGCAAYVCVRESACLYRDMFDTFGEEKQGFSGGKPWVEPICEFMDVCVSGCALGQQA